MADEKDETSVAGGAESLTEEAGETTAADMVSGPADTRPVGEGTKVEVAGDGGAAEG